MTLMSATLMCVAIGVFSKIEAVALASATAVGALTPDRTYIASSWCRRPDPDNRGRNRARESGTFPSTGNSASERAEVVSPPLLEGLLLIFELVLLDRPVAIESGRRAY